MVVRLKYIQWISRLLGDDEGEEGGMIGSRGRSHRSICCCLLLCELLDTEKQNSKEAQYTRTVMWVNFRVIFLESGLGIAVLPKFSHDLHGTLSGSCPPSPRTQPALVVRIYLPPQLSSYLRLHSFTIRNHVSHTTHCLDGNITEDGAHAPLPRPPPRVLRVEVLAQRGTYTSRTDQGLHFGSHLLPPL